MGGENIDAGREVCAGGGSSPRGRGKRGASPAPVCNLGLIPAWAGKTSASCLLPCTLTAHPRVGGENRQALARLDAAGGSSPRGRGKPRSGRARYRATGLIPAWAGKTGRARLLPFPTTAHPRVGGENISGHFLVVLIEGSSPRGRGKLFITHNALQYIRLIPAWAGKTLRGHYRHGRGAAHPRVGGENVGSDSMSMVGTGSSPRGRGKLSPTGYTRARFRLIPAWAGKTMAGTFRCVVLSAHPRVGGEN